MRRGSFIWNQQPVRNLLANPTLETATVTQVIVRTNLAPCPRMTSTYLGSYNGTGTLSTVTGIVGGPDGITTAVRNTYGAGINNVGMVVMPLPDINSQYTVTLWVLNEGATSETFAIALKGFGSSTPVVIGQNVWTKLTWTLTTPGTLVTGNDFGVRIPVSSAAGSFLTTGVLIEKGVPATGTFFDGATANGGDWTYVWTGTANASSSNQRGILPASIGVSGAAAIVQSVEWTASGGKSMRVIHTPSTTIAEAGLADIALVKPGKTYTVIGKLRIDTVATSSHTRSRRFNFYWSTNGGANYSEANGPQAPNAIGVHDVRYTFTVPEDSTNTLLRAGGNSWGNAGVLQADAWWDDIMLVEGVYEGDYVDGTKPFSQWDGAANSSASVGYPQWLYQLAGEPAVDKLGSGNTAAVTVDGFAARTIYIVYEVTTNNAAWQVPVYYGANAPTDGVTFQTAALGTNTMSPRFDFTTGGGDINRGLGITTARTPAKIHVMALTLNQGLTLASFTTNGTITSSLTLNPGSIGLTSGQVRAYNLASIRNVRTLVYYDAHDATMRQTISRYLGNKYGIATS